GQHLAQREEQGDDSSEGTRGLCWRARKAEPRAAPLDLRPRSVKESLCRPPRRTARCATSKCLRPTSSGQRTSTKQSSAGVSGSGATVIPLLTTRPAKSAARGSEDDRQGRRPVCSSTSWTTIF